MWCETCRSSSRLRRFRMRRLCLLDARECGPPTCTVSDVFALLENRLFDLGGDDIVPQSAWERRMCAVRPRPVQNRGARQAQCQPLPPRHSGNPFGEAHPSTEPHRECGSSTPPLRREPAVRDHSMPASDNGSAQDRLALIPMVDTRTGRDALASRRFSSPPVDTRSVPGCRDMALRVE